MRRRELKNMEWGLLIVAIILSIIGIIALFSATQETEYDEFKKQWPARDYNRLSAGLKSLKENRNKLFAKLTGERSTSSK